MEKKKPVHTVLGWVLLIAGLVISLIPLISKMHEKEVYKKELAEASS